MTTVLILAAVFILMGGIFVVSRYYDKQRAEQLRLESDVLGFDYQPQDYQGFLDGIPEHDLTARGRSKKFTNVMRRETDALTLTIFDYSYRTGSGKNSSTYTQTVLRLQSDQLQIPKFLLRPEHLFDKLKSALGFEHINFPDHPTFSSKYMLQGDHADEIRDLFQPEVLLFFERNLGMSVEGEGTHMLVYQSGKLVPPTELREFFERGFELFLLLRER